MLDLYASVVADLSRWLGRAQVQLEHMSAERQLPAMEALRYLRSPYYAAARPWLEELGLTSALDDLDRFERAAEALASLPLKAHEVLALLKSLSTRLYDELRRCYFVFVSDARLFQQPLAGWDAALTRFPEIAPEIEEAGRCLALQRDTACVFHLMRTLEHGLIAVASYLQIAEVGPQNWEALIGQIERVVRDIRNPKLGLPPDVVGKRIQLEGVALHFRFLKDAWRNYASHAYALYNQGQAQGAWRQVCSFMNEVAEII